MSRSPPTHKAIIPSIDSTLLNPHLSDSFDSDATDSPQKPKPPKNKAELISAISAKLKKQSEELKSKFKNLSISKILSQKRRALRKSSYSELDDSPDGFSKKNIHLSTLDGSELKHYLLQLLDSESLKYLKNGNYDSTIQAINKISTVDKYVMGVEVGSEAFYGESRSLKNLIKNIEYFQSKKGIPKDHMVILLVATEDPEGFKTYKNLLNYQTLINTKYNFWKKSGEESTLDYYTKIITYCNVLQKFEDKLIFILNLHQDKQPSDDEKPVPKAILELVNQNLEVQRAEMMKPKKQIHKIKFFDQLSGSPASQMERNMGIALIIIILFSLIVSQFS